MLRVINLQPRFDGSHLLASDLVHELHPLSPSVYQGLLHRHESPVSLLLQALVHERVICLLNSSRVSSLPRISVPKVPLKHKECQLSQSDPPTSVFHLPHNHALSSAEDTPALASDYRALDQKDASKDSQEGDGATKVSLWDQVAIAETCHGA